MPELFRGRALWKDLLGLAALVVILVIAFHYLDIEAMRARVAAAGAWAPLILVVLKASTIVVAPLGGAPLYPVAGAFFGFWEGFVLLLIGDMLGGAISFWLSRIFGRRLVERMVGTEGNLLSEALEMMSTVKGFVVARSLLVTFPELASYAAGLTKIRFLTFLVIYSLIGALPILVGVSLGSLIAEGSGSYVFFVAALLSGSVALAGVAVFGALAKRRLADRAQPKEETSDVAGNDE